MQEQQRSGMHFEVLGEEEEERGGGRGRGRGRRRGRGREGEEEEEEGGEGEGEEKQTSRTSLRGRAPRFSVFARWRSVTLGEMSKGRVETGPIAGTASALPPAVAVLGVAMSMATAASAQRGSIHSRTSNQVASTSTHRNGSMPRRARLSSVS